MVTDAQLYVERFTEYRDASNAYSIIASKYALQPDSVRGRISRADTRENQLLVAKWLANNVRPVDPSVARQQSVIEQSYAEFNRLQDGAGYGMFISDKHNPNGRWDAWDLTLQIVEDTKPKYVSVQNDWNDNKGYGRWEDIRQGKDRVWSDDIAYMRSLEEQDYKTLLCAYPKTTMLAVMGNHDYWWYNNKRLTSPQDAEKTIADYMEWLLDHGVLQFTRGFHENAIHLSPALVWVHGKWASKSAVSNARNAVRTFTKNGVAKSVVFGHSHRPSVVDGREFDINGIKVVNSGSLCRNTGVDYMAFGEAPAWSMGITRCWFNSENRDHQLELVEFKPEGEWLVARTNGKTYRSKLEE